MTDLATNVLYKCSAFWVDVRLREIGGRWIASADSSDGPTLGPGLGAVEAIEAALEPFEGLVEELMASLADSSLDLPLSPAPYGRGPRPGWRSGVP